MKGIPRPAVWALSVGVAAGACHTDITGFDDDEAFVVRMEVSGGIASADYTFEVRHDGTVLGVQCGNLCDFQPGDTLGRLTPAQRDAVNAGVLNSGLPTAGRPVNFGTECCDQFVYRVFYTTETVVRSFTGSPDALPEPLRKLVRMLHLLYQDTPPLIVAQTSGLDGFSLDPLTILDARAEAGVLEVDVTYGGGCSEHDLDAVAYTGWMESNPVQIGVAVTHDDGDDLCDALVTRTLRFDLEPLREAYAAAYGPGNSTLSLRVEPGAGAPGGTAQQVTYSF